MRKLLAAALVMIAILAVSVYRAKLGAQQAEIAIEDMEVELQALRDELVVLRNEFKHLSREQRIDQIADEALGMDVIKPEQIVSPEELKERLATVRLETELDQASQNNNGGVE